ncbi:uncharacterized protein LOC117178729 [Belonocnema kinseyi]|uniref:uncharacterized protein LOC117178729 n=1 Tax=Belonocnema kinseyi TaxID=2817044 RepID=UPI00143CF38C|nr:uncharacterized protein LOC117178729 [Belonocnema kinseyi]
MENVRKHKNDRLMTKWAERWGAKALIVKPNFHSSTTFSEDMVIIEMSKPKIKFIKPIYIGFILLDISKIMFFDFYYNNSKYTFSEKTKLLYTDTDTLIYHTTKPNFYEYVKKDSDKFYISYYPPNNVYEIELLNKKVLELMKHECNGKIVTEFVGLRSKLYSYKVLGEEGKKKKAKCIKASTLKTITFQDYRQSLLHYQTLTRPQRLIQSQKHKVHSIEQNKIGLSWPDDVDKS